VSISTQLALWTRWSKRIPRWGSSDRVGRGHKGADAPLSRVGPRPSSPLVLGEVAIARDRCDRCGCEGNPRDPWSSATEIPSRQAAIDLCRWRGSDVPWVRPWQRYQSDCVRSRHGVPSRHLVKQRRGHRYSLHPSGRPSIILISTLSIIVIALNLCVSEIIDARFADSGHLI
jgi:hypothetical protein